VKGLNINIKAVIPSGPGPEEEVSLKERSANLRVQELVFDVRGR